MCVLYLTMKVYFVTDYIHQLGQHFILYLTL